ncbi:sterigmatocystin biosynthesis monooxygenase stcW [Fusarium circinatum]|uniref:Sterigmatocystin biosynthesis monooxygenase stcW n=1 Tax=Fusarium circinatum TaxID=48490 RepID=A0A8H5X6S3_FUSCI|nr:sterigmatocystin biosynthesis monooxygenase stcW [Fusarium circinatum]
MAISQSNNESNGTQPPRTPTTKGYGQHPLHDKSQRPLKVIIVGAGPSGIAALIELKKLSHVEISCFEKNADVGGTWLETRYPGAACDVASHAYQYSFDYKTDWSRHFSPAEEIGEYFISVAKKHHLYNKITFNSRVIGAEWDDNTGLWRVQVARDISPGSDAVVEDHHAHVFINAGGILNDWKWPDIEGLHSFKGKLIHTAAWDPEIDLKGASVGIIGSGASSIQVVPAIQPLCDKIDVYVRSPTYILPTVGFGIESSNFNAPYTEADIERFNNDPEYYKTFRKLIEQQMNENFAASIKNSEAQEKGRQWAEKMMSSAIASPELREKLIPSWELGCRRLTPSLPYLKAIQEPNVNVIRTGIRRVTEKGIETDDGEIHEVDTLICATGFNTSFSSRFSIVGRNGVSLREMWKAKGPEAYLGMAIAGLPNYFNKDRKSGRVVAVWLGSSIHFMEMIANLRWEDFDIKYINSNPFSFMGNGISQREAKGEDLTYYLDDMVLDVKV